MKLAVKLGLFLILVGCLLAVTGCPHNSISGPGNHAPIVYVLSFNVGGIETQDTVFAAQDTTPIPYAIYVTLRDSATLHLIPDMLVRASGTLTIDSTHTIPLRFSHTSALTDTINPWGTDTLMNWRIAKSDTGRAHIQIRLFNSVGTLLRQAARDFVVRPAPQN
jgi:hypothetical protein